jgi:serine/threonine protein kinase
MSSNTLIHSNIAKLIAVLRNVTIKTQQGDLIEIESGALLEPYQGGELSYHLLRYGALNEATARAFLIQLTNGLKFFHEVSSCCHRDLKPWNVCLSDDCTTVKIIDFGQVTPLDVHIGEPLS